MVKSDALFLDLLSNSIFLSEGIARTRVNKLVANKACYDSIYIGFGRQHNAPIESNPAGNAITSDKILQRCNPLIVQLSP